MTADPDVPRGRSSTAFAVLLSAAAFVVVVAGMKAAAPLLVPCFLAIFIAVISGPPLNWLRSRGLPTTAALVIVVAALLVCGTAIGAVITGAVRDFDSKYDDYQTRVKEISDNVSESLERFLPAEEPDATDKPSTASDPTDASPETPSATPTGRVATLKKTFESVDLGVIFSYLKQILGELSGLLGNALFIGLTVMFILAEASSFPGKIRAAFTRSNEVEGALQRFTTSINQYIAIKTMMSLLTGVVVGVWLMVLKVDFAFLWGLLAFMLNFIPNLGSIIAAVPAVLVAWIQPGGTAALLAAGGYIVTNFVIGNFVEPRLMGKGLDLSTLVVFISLVFWGWVFGPIGMLLSVPLTMTAKIALEASDDTRWLAVLMGSGGETKAATSDAA